MSSSKTLMVGCSCFVAGVAFVLACGTGSSSPDAPHADAATSCDCPTPTPIENRIQYVTVTKSAVSSDTSLVVIADCPLNGAQLIGGFCSSQRGDLSLRDSGPSANFGDKPSSFHCTWDNSIQVDGESFAAIAMCLNPVVADAGH